MSLEKVAGILEKAVETERAHAERLRALAKRISHPVLRTLLMGIAEDSAKHAIMYEALLEIARGKIGILSPEELNAFRSEVSHHIEVEKLMIEVVEKALSALDDLRAKLVLDAIRNDEVRHHTLLLTLRDAVAERDTIDEDEFWSQVWSGSRQDSRHYAIGPRSRPG
ncbi:MAG: ferritin-like domain-containing protein [Thermoproteota archaeon]